MSWNGLPAWDGNRPIFLQTGILLALSSVLVIINHTAPVKLTEPMSFSEPEMHLFNFTEQSMKSTGIHKVKPPVVKPNPRVEPDIRDKPDIAETPENKYSENFGSDIKESPDIESAHTNAGVTSEYEEDNDIVFKVAEVMPYLSQCSTVLVENQRRQCTAENLMKYTYTTLRYPATAREQGIEGTVVISFVIDRKGMITDIEIVKDIGGGCGSEVVKALKKLTGWNPGLHNGIPVNVKFTLPVKFSLQR